MTRCSLLAVVALLLVAASCSTGDSDTAGPAGGSGEADPLTFSDSQSGSDRPDTTEGPADDLSNRVDPVIVEGLAQAVVADQSGQSRGVVITIEEARCLSARTVLALGVERLGELNLTEQGLAEGRFGQAVAVLSVDERAELVDATLSCVPVETLVGSAAGLTAGEITCLADRLEESEILRVLALDHLSGSDGATTLDGELRDEFLDAIRTCVDLAGLMFSGTDVSAESVACVGDAVRSDPLLDQVFAAVIDGEDVGENAATALQAVVGGCLDPQELAALAG
ncbi:MAG: hypothetical protein GY929_16920 [Actinomycetia bacterium]|nr:hypothetical protein [Actinomycetes bacterium]